MAKESGVGITTLSVDDSGGSARALVNDIGSFNFATPRGVQDVTGVDSSAIERLLLLADFSITMNGFFNDAGNASHDVFKTASSSSVMRTITFVHSGQTLPNECAIPDYPLTRSPTGELTWAVTALLSSTTVPTWA
tara:strand:- start:512 stop:919 length:408 start_codon:yes stop_codon:yes gene_type:complete